jgi:hypothetical protein
MGAVAQPLTQEEIDGCKDAFLAFDKDRSGTIDVWELRQVLEGTAPACSGRSGACAIGDVRARLRAAMGQKPTEEELFQMISEVDDNMSGAIGMRGGLPMCTVGARLTHRRCLSLRRRVCADFGEFLKVVEKQKERAAMFDDESDMSAFL